VSFADDRILYMPEHLQNQIPLTLSQVLQLPAEDAAALEFQVWVKGFDYICLVQGHRHGFEEPAALQAMLEKMPQSTGTSSSQSLADIDKSSDDRRQTKAVDKRSQTSFRGRKATGARQLFHSDWGSKEPGRGSMHAAASRKAQGNTKGSPVHGRRSTLAEEAAPGSLPLYIVMFGPYMTAKHSVNMTDYVTMLVWHIAWHTKVGVGSVMGAACAVREVPEQLMPGINTLWHQRLA
jgi:hypothetical protein